MSVGLRGTETSKGKKSRHDDIKPLNILHDTSFQLVSIQISKIEI